MAFTWVSTNALGEIVSVAWGNERSNGVKQLANDLYITPANGGDGVADLTYPLQQIAPIFTSMALGNSTTGTTVNLPAGYTPSSADDYEVICSWQEDPGGNGHPYVVKTTTNFVIKHYGSVTGKKIGYSIIRKTA